MTRKPTQALKSSVNAYLLARANAELHREKVNKIAKNILSTASYFADKKWERRGLKLDDLRIEDPEKAYLLSDEEHADYLIDLKHALIKAGYEIKSIKGEPESSYHCPALTAEHLQTKTEHIVIDSMAEFLKEEENFRHRLLCSGLEKYNKFLDLSVKFVVNSPDFKNPLTNELV
jgi:hypothetical protein